MIDELQRQQLSFIQPTIADNSTPEAQTADELLDRFRTQGLSPALALRIAGFIHHALPATQSASSALREDAQETLWLSLCRLLEAPKTKFSLGCFMLAHGYLHRVVRSERQWAQDRFVSPTHVSNEVRAWQELLGLPKTEFQKSAAACAKYRTHNRARIAS